MKFTSLSVRIWTSQLEIIKKAARATDVTVPEYVRSKLLPVAAKDAGVELPEFPPFHRGRPSVQSQVAAQLGVPVEQWRKEILNEAAENFIKRLGSGAPILPPVRVKRKA